MQQLTPEALEQLELLLKKVERLKNMYCHAHDFAVRRIQKCVSVAKSHTNQHHALDVAYEKQILHKLMVCDEITVCLTFIDWYEQSDEYHCNDALQQAKAIINQIKRAA